MPSNISIRLFELSELRWFAAAAAQGTDDCPKDPFLLSKIISALLVRWERIASRDARFLKSRIALADPKKPPSLQEVVNVLTDRFRPEESRLLKWLIRCLASAEDRVEDSRVFERLLGYIGHLIIPDGMHWTPIVLAQRITLASYLEHMEKRGYSRDPVDVLIEPDPYPFGSKVDGDLRRLWLIKHEASLLRVLNFPCRCHFPRSLAGIIQRQDDDRWIGECHTKETLIVRILSEWHAIQDKAIRELLSPKRRANFNSRPKS